MQEAASNLPAPQSPAPADSFGRSASESWKAPKTGLPQSAVQRPKSRQAQIEAWFDQYFDQEDTDDDPYRSLGPQHAGETLSPALAAAFDQGWDGGGSRSAKGGPLPGRGKSSLDPAQSKPAAVAAHGLQEEPNWLQELFSGNSLHSGENNGIKDYENIADSIPDINALNAGGGLIRADKRRREQREAEEAAGNRPNTANPYTSPRVVAAEKKFMEDQLSDDDKKAGITVKTVDGACYYDYTDVVMNRLDEVLPEFQDNYVTFLRNYFDTDGTGTYDELKEVPIVDKLMFFTMQVNHYMPWDIKRDDSWTQQFGDIRMPYYGNEREPEQVLFRGEQVTREDLGNITYGYLGSAMGIPDWMLYIGGGVAKQGMDILKPSAFLNGYLGDDPNDHRSILKGIEYYYEDHPNETPSLSNLWK